MAKTKYSNSKFTERTRELIDYKLAGGETYKLMEQKSGVPQASLNEYYSGERVASTENLVRLAEYFDVSVDYLLGIDKTCSVSAVSNYLGIDYKAAIGLKESIDKVNALISEEENIGITKSVLDTIISSDKRFLSVLVMIVCSMREMKDMDLYRSAPALKDKVILRSPFVIDDEEYLNFKNWKILLEYLDYFTDNCESNFSKDDIDRIMSAETTKDLLLQMNTYKTPAINSTIWRTFANAFISENKDDEQIKSMIK